MDAADGRSDVTYPPPLVVLRLDPGHTHPRVYVCDEILDAIQAERF